MAFENLYWGCGILAGRLTRAGYYFLDTQGYFLLF